MPEWLAALFLEVRMTSLLSSSAPFAASALEHGSDVIFQIDEIQRELN